MNNKNEMLMLKALNNEGISYLENTDEMEFVYPNQRLIDLFRTMVGQWNIYASTMNELDFKNFTIDFHGEDFYEDQFEADKRTTIELREEFNGLIKGMQEYDNEKYGVIV